MRPRTGRRLLHVSISSVAMAAKSQRRIQVGCKKLVVGKEITSMHDR